MKQVLYAVLFVGLGAAAMAGVEHVRSTRDALASASGDALVLDAATLRLAGEALEREGIVTTAAVSGATGALELTAASAADASALAQAVCGQLSGKVSPGWKVAVFAPPDGAPAAGCTVEGKRPDVTPWAPQGEGVEEQAAR